jgi:small subunit ribosomal protein S14
MIKMETAYERIAKTLKGKPAKYSRFTRFNQHKTQPHDARSRRCIRCNRPEGLVSMHGLNYCRECFREVAKDLGFRKYGKEA